MDVPSRTFSLRLAAAVCAEASVRANHPADIGAVRDETNARVSKRKAWERARGGCASRLYQQRRQRGGRETTVLVQVGASDDEGAEIVVVVKN